MTFSCIFQSTRTQTRWVGVVNAFLLQINDIFDEIEVWNLKIDKFMGVNLQKSKNSQTDPNLAFSTAVHFLKAWSRSVYSHTCYAYCQGFLPCLFLPFRSIHLQFFKTSHDFSCVGCKRRFLCRPGE